MRTNSTSSRVPPIASLFTPSSRSLVLHHSERLPEQTVSPLPHGVDHALGIIRLFGLGDRDLCWPAASGRIAVLGDRRRRLLHFGSFAIAWAKSSRPEPIPRTLSARRSILSATRCVAAA